jgi:hypothetical protein
VAVVLAVVAGVGGRLLAVAMAIESPHTSENTLLQPTDAICQRWLRHMKGR